MKLINPYYSARERNIFNIREGEYSSLIDTVREILAPVEELDFQVTELRLKDSKISGGDLQKTVKQTLVIKLQKGNSIVDLSMSIPKLVDGNYVIINGRKKIPLFQLFDIPIVTRGKSIKMRTNVATIVISETKEVPYVYMSFLGKKVPMFLLMIAYFGLEELNNRFDLENVEPQLDTTYGKLLDCIKSCYEEDADQNPEDIIREIGSYYTKYSPKTKGEDVVYALDLIPKVDVMSAKFFKTETVLDELLDVIVNGGYDDTDFINKRIRCWEYIVTSKISKAVFDLCMSNRTSRNPKFNIHSTQILSECNVSDIVQFDFSINPVDELTKLSRTSLVGPGGFKRENVPEHLRDITDTMFGRMCPVDTPDRDNCGVLQNLLVNSKLDENLKFSEDFLEKQPVSAPVSMVPFLEHDDQTRLQMASSQMRQAIMLRDFDTPMIQSGCENLYSHYTQFVKVAKKDGDVIYRDNKWIIVRYEDDTADIFDIGYRKIYVQNLDYMNIYVKEGDKFKAGDILAESNFCEDGHINIGKNLLTAVTVYYGHNYEDGIVISDRLVKDGAFTSVHYIDLSFHLPPNKVLLSLDEDRYKPVPDILENVQMGQPYARIKEMPAGPIDFCDIFGEETSLVTRRNTLTTEVNIYANQWNEEIPEFKKWVEDKIEEQVQKEIDFQKVLFQHFSKEVASQFVKDNNLDKFSHKGKYKLKGEKINGIYVEMFGIYTRKIQVGDKIGNRHGNKGVISAIVPHEQMPQLEDGRHVDVCINPLGIISRMNIGQLFELHLAMSLGDLKIELRAMLENGKSQEEVKNYLKGFIEIIDNTEIKWYSKQFEEQLPDVIDEKFIQELTVLQPPFESVTGKLVEEALEYTGTPFEYNVHDPVSKQNLLNNIAVGYMYFFRMVHIAENRLASRGVGTYTKKTLQPLAGRKNKGGQRCGEMETACLIGHDAITNLFEFMTTKSDCIDLKNQYIRETIDSDLIKEEGEIDIVPESVKLLNACLTVIGIVRD